MIGLGMYFPLHDEIGLSQSLLMPASCNQSLPFGVLGGTKKNNPSHHTFLLQKAAAGLLLLIRLSFDQNGTAWANLVLEFE
eukprot:scaffold22593_cov19-Prasinocladus_malaysianus.AAC.1